MNAVTISYTASFITRLSLSSHFQSQNSKKAHYQKLQPLKGLSQNTPTMSQHSVMLEGSDISHQPKGFFMALVDDVVLRSILCEQHFILTYSLVHLWA